MKPAVMISLLFAQSLCGQAIWTDSFQNVSYLTQSVWFGDTSLFIVNNDDKLQLQAFGSGSSRLYRGSSAGYQSVWQFHIELGFNPSSSNHCRVYLAKADNSGLYVAFGEGGRDAIELGYTYSGLDSTWGRSTSVLDSSLPSGILKVEQDSVGVYRVFWNPSNGIQRLLFSCSGPPSIPSSLLEIQCTYTSTRSDKFWFDDFDVSGQVHRDLFPPTVLNIDRRISTFENEMELIFSTPVSGGPIAWSDGTLAFDDSLFDVSQIQIIKPKKHGIWTLDLGGLTDSLNRPLDSVITQFQMATYTPHWYPTEIMADPTPSRGLPEREYLELYSDMALDIPKGILSINGDSMHTPALWNPKNATMVLSAEPYPDIENNWVVEGFNLPNDSADIRWYDYNGNLIWQAKYRDIQHNYLGRQGGYSFEIQNAIPQCPCPENWGTTNKSQGGSPGEYDTNFHSEDPSISRFTELWFVENGTLHITWPLPIIPGKYKAQWSLESQPDEAWVSADNPKSLCLPISPVSDRLILHSIPLDCSGDSIDVEFFFERPKSLGEDEVETLVISEVLFDAELSSEFIELANPNSFPVYVPSFWFAEYWMDTPHRISQSWDKKRKYILPRKGVVAISEETHLLNTSENQTATHLSIHDFPALSDVEGSIYLEWESGFSSIAFSRDLHNPIPENPDDYSLGRKYTTEGPWISVHLGTPGWKQDGNSPSHERLKVEPRVLYSSLTPLRISVEVDDNSTSFSVFILDKEGRLILQVAEDHFGSGHWDWNGEANGPLPFGPYFVLCQFEDGTEVKKCAIAPH